MNECLKDGINSWVIRITTVGIGASISVLTKLLVHGILWSMVKNFLEPRRR